VRIAPEREDAAEIEYKPTACDFAYRMVVVRRNITIVGRTSAGDCTTSGRRQETDADRPLIKGCPLLQNRPQLSCSAGGAWVGCHAPMRSVKTPPGSIA